MTPRILTTLTLSLAVLAAACGSGESAPSGTAEEILNAVFVESGVEDWGEVRTLETEQDLDYYLGSTNYPEFADSAVNQALIRVDPRIMYVLILDDADQVPDVMAQLEEDVDPARLICVQFELDDVAMTSRDNVIYMTINPNHEERDSMVDAFMALA